MPLVKDVVDGNDAPGPGNCCRVWYSVCGGVFIFPFISCGFTLAWRNGILLN